MRYTYTIFCRELDPTNHVTPLVMWTAHHNTLDAAKRYVQEQHHYSDHWTGPWKQQSPTLWRRSSRLWSYDIEKRQLTKAKP